MPQDRALHTHIAFRNTYNHYYEAVRPSNNIPTLFSDHHAYELSEEYYKECSGIVKIFHKVKSKTYGVRDEYRVSGQAAQVLLEQIIPQEIYEGGRNTKNPDPVKKHNPPNMEIITGVLNHMLRCIVSTPIVYDFHVRDSLALLKWRIVAEKAGMFFLHDLDLDFLPCLDDVEESDDLRVLFLMGVNAKRQARLEGLSMATKNKRKPPQRIKAVSKPRELAELSSDDEEEFAGPIDEIG
ncbi:hypothetical protein OG21DRAFT_1488945 [Imleria badia]|nr:hypothetical protein OG21DRAFT_1488945 [Imleria badia]